MKRLTAALAISPFCHYHRLVKRKTISALCLIALSSLPVHAALSLDAGGDKSVVRESDTAVKNAPAAKADSPAKAAITAFEQEKYDEAIKLATPLAEKGDADAIYLLGFAYETGKGVAQSREKAVEYYRKGMEKFHADSIYRLSFILMASQDKAEVQEARTILEKQGLTDTGIAGRILGEAFLLGRFGDEPDTEKALSWWGKSSDQGDVPSTILLARFYEGQMGSPEKRDPAAAFKNFQKAADAGNPAAMVATASRMLYGDKAFLDEKKGLALIEKAIVANEYTAYLARGTWQEQVKKDDKAALADFERGKDAGQIDCMLRAAEYYLQGKGTEKDPVRAGKILQTAADAGSPQAHLMIAANIFQSKEPDIIKGYQHLLTAANASLPAAQNEVGLLYIAGKLGVADPAAAVTWFTRSAQGGFAAAQNNLGALFERGSGVEQSYEKAAQLYSLAAQQGHASATLALGRFHAAGAATKVNKERAWALGKIAEEGGEPNAPEFLKTLEKEFTKEQLAAAKKELERIKTDKPETEEKPAAKPAAKPAGK